MLVVMNLEKNSHCQKFWHRANSCIINSWKGENVGCHPPYNDKEQPEIVNEILQHFISEHAASPLDTQATFVMPLHMCPPKDELRQNHMEVVFTYPKYTKLFYSTDPKHDSVLSRYPICVIHAPTLDQPLSDGVGYKVPNPPDTIQSNTPTIDNFLTCVRKRQYSDSELKSTIEHLTTTDHLHEGNYTLYADLLWYVKNGRYQLVIPRNANDLKQRVLEASHDHPSSGHLGYRKTMNRIQRDFYWSNLKDDVNLYCKTCKVCQAVKPPNNGQQGPLSPYSSPDKKWSVVTLDIITGLLDSDNGNNSIITFTDKLTKMVHIVPFRFDDSKAPEIANLFFKHVWKLHGLPTKLISDRDPRFSSHFWQELMRALGVHVALTTPYNPSSDGQSENTNKTVEQILRAYVDPRQTKLGPTYPRSRICNK